MRRLPLAAVLLLGLVAAPKKALPEPPRPGAPGKPGGEGLTPPRDLSAVLRELLHRRMQLHGADMTQLVTKVVLLRHEDVVPLADRIVSAPRLLSPEPGDGEDLSARLPKRIFLLDEELRDRARALSEAARARDDARLGRAFGATLETCVACHAAYRGGERRGPAR